MLTFTSRFLDVMKISASQIFPGLLADDRSAIKDCKTFLRWLVRTTKKRVLVLDDRESIWVRSINTITTVINIWVRIMAEGDRVVLAPLRSRESDLATRCNMRLISTDCTSKAGKTWPMKAVSLY
jgi:hypothetical protein